MTDVSRGQLARIARRFVARIVASLNPSAEGSSLRILTYHRVNEHHPDDRMTVHPRSFLQQMEHLAASGRPVLRLSEAVARLSGAGPALSAGSVALTFDDGYRDNLESAAPVLERFGFSATVFLVTRHMGAPAPIDRYARCCEHDSALTWAEAREMRDRGHGLGGHGRTHRELAPLEAAAMRDEIFGCRDDMLSALGEAPGLFCYPRGSESPAVRRTVGEAGFEAAVTVYPGVNAPAGDPLLLRRTEVSGQDDLTDFRLKLEGGYDAWHRLWQRFRSRGA
jgi:peptidoglycan/xylan/chitin deacetylase (PgdA/CDA1 family)